MAYTYVPYDGPIVTRAEAKATGLKRYFTGKPCKVGHLAECFVNAQTCIACRKIRLQARTDDQLAESRVYHQKYRADHAVALSDYGKEYYIANRDACLAKSLKNQAADKDATNARSAKSRQKKKKSKEDAYEIWRVEQEAKLGRKIVTRKEALAIGADRYFNGIPCEFGHLSERYTKSPSCVECRSDYSINWYSTNIDRKALSASLWQANNKLKSRAITHTYRAKKKFGGKHTAADIEWLLQTQKFRCAHSWCRVSVKKKYHVDHIIPISAGGSNNRRNLQILCKTCNLKKQAKHPIDYARKHGMLL